MAKNIEFLREKYNEPGHALAYSSPHVIFEYLRSIGKKISLDKIKYVLSEFDSHTLHKTFRKPKFFNPYFIYRRRQQIQADLIDIKHLADKNDGTNYLFALIDAFSKRAWVYPLKSKKTKEVSEVFLNHLNSNIDNNIFQVFLSDAGTEFTGREMQKVLEKYSIFFQIGRGYNKTSICERFNKTFQVLLYKYMTQNETERYIDVLPSLLDSYNNRPHRTLRGLSPMEADDKNNEIHIRGILRKKYFDVPSATKRELAQSFELGDIVRIKKLTTRISSENRAYSQQQKPEYFMIDKIDTRMPRALYHIKSLSLGDHIQGGFYKHELTLVTGNVYKVEKIIRSKGKGRNKKYFVKWMHFGPEHNSWVDSKDFVASYAN